MEQTIILNQTLYLNTTIVKVKRKSLVAVVARAILFKYNYC